MISRPISNIWFLCLELCEECALATSLRDLGDLPESLEDSESVTFDVKYLGDTTVEVRKANANSTEAIGQAVKSVLSAAKGNHRLLSINCKRVHPLD